MDALFDSLQPPKVFCDVVPNECRLCSGETIVMEGLKTCKSCFAQEVYLEPNQINPHEPLEVCCFAYKRVNHFREIVAQFQAKEITTIPPYILDLVEAHKGDLSYAVTKQILKGHGLKRYYEHITFINERFGVKPPFIPLEVESHMTTMFIQIQAPYMRHRPDSRNNFLAYHFVLKKLFELVRFTDYIPLLQVLKDKKKLKEQLHIWKLICTDLGWTFIE